MKSLHTFGDWLAPKRVLVTGSNADTGEVGSSPNESGPPVLSEKLPLCDSLSNSLPEFVPRETRIFAHQFS
jgi:hypothetical protein